MKLTNLIKVLLVLVVFCTGCSLVFMGKVPGDYHPRQEPDCVGCIPPILDGIVSVTLGVFSGILITSGLEHNSPDDWFDGIGEISGSIIGVVSILYLVSTLYGTLRASDCYNAHDAHQKWLDMNSEEKKRFDEQWRKGQRKRNTKIKDEGKVESLAW